MPIPNKYAGRAQLVARRVKAPPVIGRNFPPTSRQPPRQRGQARNRGRS